MPDQLTALLVGVVLLVIGVGAPVLLVVQLFRVALRRYSGRKGKYDRLFEGMGRAATMYSHLSADTPLPDDLAVPTTETPAPGPRRRRRRHA